MGFKDYLKENSPVVISEERFEDQTDYHDFGMIGTNGWVYRGEGEDSEEHEDIARDKMHYASLADAIEAGCIRYAIGDKGSFDSIFEFVIKRNTLKNLIDLVNMYREQMGVIRIDYHLPKEQQDPFNGEHSFDSGLKFLNVLKKIYSSINEEVLDEGQQDYINYLGAYLKEPGIKAFLDWSKKWLKKQDKVMWFLRFVRLYAMYKYDKPAYDSEIERLKKTPDKDFITKDDHTIFKFANFERVPNDYMRRLMNSLEHYYGQLNDIPKLDNVVFKFQTAQDLIIELTKIENEYKEKLRENERLIADDPKEYTTVIKFPDGFQWQNLNKSYCDKEGNAMGHCGNIEGKQRTTDRILSLREPVKKGKELFWKPHATFILMEGGWLGEMKGYGNELVSDKYHPYIVKLLEDTNLIKGIKSGFGYLPESNFSLKDLTDDEFKRLLKLNPNLGTFEDIKDAFGADSKEYKEKAAAVMGSLFDKLEEDSPYYVLGMYDSLGNLLDQLPGDGNGVYDDLHNGDVYEYNQYNPSDEQIRQDIADVMDDELDDKAAEHYGLDEYDPDDLYDKMMDDDDLRSELYGAYQSVGNSEVYNGLSTALFSWIDDVATSLQPLPIDFVYKDPFSGDWKSFSDYNHVPNKLIYEKVPTAIVIDSTSSNFEKFLNGYLDMIEKNNGYFDVGELDWSDAPKHVDLSNIDSTPDSSEVESEMKSIIKQHVKHPYKHPAQQELDLSHVEVEEEVLDEGQQDYINFLGKYADEMYAQGSLKWAKENLKKQDRVMWFLRFIKLYMMFKFDKEAYKAEVAKLEKTPAKDYFFREKSIPSLTVKEFEKDPTDYISLIKNTLLHYTGIANIIPEINNVVFKFQTPSEIFDELGKIEKANSEKLEQDKQAIPMEPGDEIIHKFPDGYAWINLNKSYCEKEAKSMGHCGNIEGKTRTDDQILSLNKIIKRGNETYRVPHLTFILGGDGRLGEMKGRANEKPNAKYHPYIIELLKNKDLIQGIKPNAGYMPSHNFKLSDLPEDKINELVKINPDLGSFEDQVKIKGHDDPEIIEQARQILNDHDVELWSKDSDMYVMFSVKDFHRLQYEVAFPDELEKLIKNIADMNVDDFEDYVDKLLEELPSEAEDKLAAHYNIKEKDFDTREEFLWELSDKLRSDKDLVAEIEDLFKTSGALAEYLKAAKASAIEWAAQLMPEYYMYDEYDSQYYGTYLVYNDGNELKGISNKSNEELAKAYDDADWYCVMNIPDYEAVDMAISFEEGQTLEQQNDYDRDRYDEPEIPVYDVSKAQKEFNKLILRYLGVGRVEDPRQQELDLSHVTPSFKDYLKEVHYTDLFGKQFQEFVKKYESKKNDPTLFVQFTNYAPDVLEKNPFKATGRLSQKHGDPVGVYGYPLSFVINSPGKIAFGADKKYLRVLKNVAPEDKTLVLQQLGEYEVAPLLDKIYNGQGDDVYKEAEQDILASYRKAEESVEPGLAYFWSVQRDVLSKEYKDTPVDRRASSSLTLPGDVQSDRIKKTGFTVLIDLARDSREAIINPAEHTQAIFLDRHSFKILDVYTVNDRAVSSDPLTAPITRYELTFKKLAALIAKKLNMKIDNAEFTDNKGQTYTVAFDNGESFDIKTSTSGYVPKDKSSKNTFKLKGTINKKKYEYESQPEETLEQTAQNFLDSVN